MGPTFPKRISVFVLHNGSLTPYQGTAFFTNSKKHSVAAIQSAHSTSNDTIIMWLSCVKSAPQTSFVWIQDRLLSTRSILIHKTTCSRSVPALTWRLWTYQQHEDAIHELLRLEIHDQITAALRAVSLPDDNRLLRWVNHIFRDLLVATGEDPQYGDYILPTSQVSPVFADCC